MTSDLAHRPLVLFAASLERLDAARLAANHADWVMATYLAGLSVECLLQAFALRAVPTHDARHDLSMWLNRCPASLQQAVIRKTWAQWNMLVRVWRNDLRYQSKSGLLGYLRRTGLNRGVRGGREAIMKSIALTFVSAASAVHAIGVAQWTR